jgi:hypothetical protein
MSKSHSRRAVLAGIATAPALAAAPALALSGPDPIFAAIEEYTTAVTARTAAMCACWGYGKPKSFAKDGSEAVAAEATHDAARDREFELLDNLLATQPTTVSGMHALLEKLAADPYAAVEGDDPDVIPDPLMNMALERSPDLVGRQTEPSTQAPRRCHARATRSDV